MIHNEVVPNILPKIPTRWDSLFESEESSDVIFMAGPNGEEWRVPAHSTILRKNPVFRAMFEGPWASEEKTIYITDVNGQAFDLLIRHIYGRSVEFKSHDMALDTLYVANKYLCPELVKKCVIYLDGEIKDKTIADIYRQLRLYASTFSTFSFSNPFPGPSAPPEEGHEEDESEMDEESEEIGKHMIQYCNSLLYNCYHYIDTNAETLLTSGVFEELSHEHMLDIVSRDNLRISNETILFDALMRWCIQKCKSNQMELAKENFKQVLGDQLIFSVRYLLMTVKEFENGPACSGLLDELDADLISSRLQGWTVTDLASIRLTGQIWDSMGRPRHTTSYIPLPLSERSKTIRDTDNVKKDKKKKKLPKNRKKQRNGDEEDEPESRCFTYTLNVLSTIFD